MSEGGPARTAYVISNGWHTGIVIARGDLPDGRIPERADFPGAAWLEFGWGDREYYPAADPGALMALAAVAKPGPAVMHVASRSGPPQPRGDDDRVQAIRLSPEQMEALVAGIDASFERPDGGRAAAISAGLTAKSRFYSARGRFHLFNNCNTWTARQLAGAGLGMPTGVIRAREVMAALSRLPEAVGPEG